jgi:flagellar protein FlaG
MVGNSMTVTAAPARTPAPTVQKTAPSTEAPGLPAGNAPPATGQELPHSATPVAAVLVEHVVRRLEEFMSETQRSLRFRVDEASGRTVITVLDAETNEVVRQIPPPEFLAVVRHLQSVGSLLDERG